MSPCTGTDSTLTFCRITRTCSMSMTLTFVAYVAAAPPDLLAGTP